MLVYISHCILQPSTDFRESFQTQLENNKSNSAMKLHLLALGLVMSLMASLMEAATEPPASDESQEAESTEGKSVDQILEEANKDLDLFEGDIRTLPGKNAVYGTGKWPKYGSRYYVFFMFSYRYSSSQKNRIRSVLRGIESRTCMRFYELPYHWGRYFRHLYIFPGSGCWSYIGRVGWRRQWLSLNTYCFSTSTIQHEMLHAIGFAHEQSRSDRDSHVRILYQNIRPGKAKNFRRYYTNNLGTPYDFNSVMHYSNYAFTKNGQMTLQSKRNPSLQFGRATSMSTYDFLRVNRYYRCPRYL